MRANLASPPSQTWSAAGNVPVPKNPEEQDGVEEKHCDEKRLRQDAVETTALRRLMYDT